MNSNSQFFPNFHYLEHTLSFLFDDLLGLEQLFWNQTHAYNDVAAKLMLNECEMAKYWSEVVHQQQLETRLNELNYFIGDELKHLENWVTYLESQLIRAPNDDERSKMYSILKTLYVYGAYQDALNDENRTHAMQCPLISVLGCHVDVLNQLETSISQIEAKFAYVHELMNSVKIP